MSDELRIQAPPLSVAVGLVLVASLVVTIAALTVGAWEAYRAVEAEDKVRWALSTERSCRDDLAEAKGRLKQVNGLFELVDPRRRPAGGGQGDSH